eukprot:1348716-Prymnesium_polylepis.1
MRDQLRVGVARHRVALALQLRAQVLEVLDDPVVHDTQRAVEGHVRVRVDVVRRAVRRPARVRNPERARDRRRHGGGGEVFDLAGGLDDLETVARSRRRRAPPLELRHRRLRARADVGGRRLGARADRGTFDRLDDGEASRVVAAVLEALQPGEQDLTRLRAAKVGYNAAH